MHCFCKVGEGALRRGDDEGQLPFIRRWMSLHPSLGFRQISFQTRDYLEVGDLEIDSRIAMMVNPLGSAGFASDTSQFKECWSRAVKGELMVLSAERRRKTKAA